MYSLIIIGIKTHRWSIQTFVLVELILVYTILMPITLLHPYVILVTNQYVLLSMSILQKYSFVQMCILGYYLSFIYAFATVKLICIRNILVLGHRFNRGKLYSSKMAKRINTSTSDEYKNNSGDVKHTACADRDGGIW